MAEPDYLRDRLRADVEAHTPRLITRFGEPGRVWAAGLPALLPRLAARWELRIERMYAGGNSGVALRCRDRAGRSAVLKLSPDRAAIAAQAHTLRLFAPSGRTPEVHAADADLGAVLLAAVDPGTPVSQVAGGPSVAAFAALLRDFRKAVPDATITADLRSGSDGFFARARRRLTDPRVAGHVTAADLDRGLARRDELLATPGRPGVLLHGDLHLDNVLDGGERGLLAIDPGACVGDRCFDAVDYVFLTPTVTPDDHAVRGMDYRLRAIAEAADLDRDRLAAWCRACAPVLAVTALRKGAGRSRVEMLLSLSAA